MHSLTLLALLIAAVAVTPSLASAGDQRMLRKEVIVKATLSEVWNAWATEEGLRFISNSSNVELRIGGPYEWFLDLPPDENGLSGGQGAKVLAYVPQEMLAFTWTFPPTIPELRSAGETTQVVVRFDELAENEVRVDLVALDWREGEPWDRGWDYFDNAWSVVLARLKSSFEPDAS